MSLLAYNKINYYQTTNVIWGNFNKKVALKYTLGIFIFYNYIIV